MRFSSCVGRRSLFREHLQGLDPAITISGLDAGEDLTDGHPIAEMLQLSFQLLCRILELCHLIPESHGLLRDLLACLHFDLEQVQVVMEQIWRKQTWLANSLTQACSLTVTKDWLLVHVWIFNLNFRLIK